MSRPGPLPEGAGQTPSGGVGTPLDDLRRRMLVLVRLLPFEHLRLLEGDLDDLEAEAFSAPLLGGLSDSTALVASDVEPALRAVWARS